MVGTLENLAPEQVRGAEADARSDIWAVGTLLYEMLTGRAPFSAASTGDLYRRIVEADYVPLSTLNPAVNAELEAVVARCLKKRPSDRYQSAGELKRDLERLGAPPPRVAPRPQTDYAALVRKPWVMGAMAAVVVLIVVLVAVAVFSGPSRDDRKEQGGDTGKIVTVDVAGPAAEVYREGRMVGRTPFEVRTRSGESVRLTLKRGGCADVDVRFDVTERSNYTYVMECGRQ